MAHKFVLLVKEFHLEREWADVVNIVVGKFPLLGDLPQRTQRTTEESTVAADWRRETQIGEVGRELTRIDTNQNQEPQRSAEAGEMGPGHSFAVTAQAGLNERQTYHGGAETRGAAETEGTPLMAIDNTNRQYGGMKLGKVVTAALAIEILMATMGSGQQPAVSTPPEQSDWNVANSKWQEHNKDQAEALVNTVRACAGGPAPCGRPVVYGEPLGLAAMAHAPTNELGVLFLFGIVAADLGFRVERLQAAFPDCEAKREVAPGKWELVFIELEIYSRNFKLHRHNPRGCHAIVCWKHNWPDCPEWLEVIELCKVVKGKIG
jgi:hypothetical protein